MQHLDRPISQASIEAICKSPVSMALGPVDLTPASVQWLIENEKRERLHITVSSIDSSSFRRLAEVKALKGIVLKFELTEQDIQSIASFPKDVELTIYYDTNVSQEDKIEAAIKSRN